MQRHLKQYFWFYIPVLLFIVAGFILLAINPHGLVVRTINQSHHPISDMLFSYITRLGEWIGGLLIGVIILLFREIKYLFIFLIAISLSSSFSLLLKTQVFNNHKRPSAQYEEIRTAEGVELHQDYSFPSGHATAAFCMFGIFAMTFRKENWQIAGAILAISVAFSRMYLGQHFLVDVVGGACLGSFVAGLVFYTLETKFKSKALNKRLFYS